MAAENDDWTGDDLASLAQVAADSVHAFPFTQGTLDSALVLQLLPGLYTATLTGKDGTEGIGLVEMYLVR